MSDNEVLTQQIQKTYNSIGILATQNFLIQDSRRIFVNDVAAVIKDNPDSKAKLNALIFLKTIIVDTDIKKIDTGNIDKKGNQQLVRGKNEYGLFGEISRALNDVNIKNDKIGIFAKAVLSEISNRVGDESMSVETKKILVQGLSEAVKGQSEKKYNDLSQKLESLGSYYDILITRETENLRIQKEQEEQKEKQTRLAGEKEKLIAPVKSEIMQLRSDLDAYTKAVVNIDARLLITGVDFKQENQQKLFNDGLNPLNRDNFLNNLLAKDIDTIKKEMVTLQESLNSMRGAIKTIIEEKPKGMESEWKEDAERKWVGDNQHKLTSAEEYKKEYQNKKTGAEKAIPSRVQALQQRASGMKTTENYQVTDLPQEPKKEVESVFDKAKKSQNVQVDFSGLKTRLMSCGVPEGMNSQREYWESENKDKILSGYVKDMKGVAGVLARWTGPIGRFFVSRSSDFISHKFEVNKAAENITKACRDELTQYDQKVKNYKAAKQEILPFEIAVNEYNNLMKNYNAIITSVAVTPSKTDAYMKIATQLGSNHGLSCGAAKELHEQAKNLYNNLEQLKVLLQNMNVPGMYQGQKTELKEAVVSKVSEVLDIKMKAGEVVSAYENVQDYGKKISERNETIKSLESDKSRSVTEYVTDKKESFETATKDLDLLKEPQHVTSLKAQAG